ncbi:hypothetical protein [uncultured Amphritea sp.]|uniref:hypothetical protein n=1 Tax=uncultured Amphritea sp. TaxID=981605 RepID=UPI00261C9A00|nr:hypothetical protein [uncultured Amphritea sp.]
MNAEYLFLFLLYAGLILSVALIATGLVLVGYAIKGAVTGTGVMNEIRPIISGYE